MKDRSELMNLVEKYLNDACMNLWDVLTPEERGVVFGRSGLVGQTVIAEYVEMNY